MSKTTVTRLFIGSLIAFSEGAEAAQPFRPELKPIDAYCSAILDNVHLG